LAMLLSCGQQIMQYRLVRERRFRLTAAASVAQAVLVNLLRIGWGLVQPTAAILVNTFVAGIGLQTLLMAVRGRGAVKEPSPAISLPALAKRYRDFPLFRAPQDVLNAASQGLPVLFLAAYYGPHAAGFFALARSVVGAPMDLISTSVGNALYPRFADAANHSRPLSGLLLKSTAGLFAIGAAPFAILAILGPDIFSVAFGDRWREAGQYAAWIGIWMAVGLANTPSVRAIPVIGAQRFQLIFGIVVLVARLAAMLGAAWAGATASMAVLIFAVTGAVLNLVLILICVRLSRSFDLSRAVSAA
jgi:O-antigen/teichoic acid export membrane protein